MINGTSILIDIDHMEARARRRVLQLSVVDTKYSGTQVNTSIDVIPNLTGLLYKYYWHYALPPGGQSLPSAGFGKERKSKRMRGLG